MKNKSRKNGSLEHPSQSAVEDKSVVAVHALQLDLFNDRVDSLDKTALARRFANPNFTIDFDRMMARDWTAVDGVTKDGVDAFVFNLRLLIQVGDGISLKELRQQFYEHPCTPAEIRRRFAHAVDGWHQHQEASSIIGRIGQKGSVYTNRELFDILIYGCLAHMNPNKVAEAMCLTRAGAFSVLVFASFLSSLHKLLSVLREVRGLNVELLNHIRTESRPNEL